MHTLTMSIICLSVKLITELIGNFTECKKNPKRRAQNVKVLLGR